MYPDVMQDDSARFKVTQMTDTGASVTLTLTEDIELEAVSQQQMMLESIDRAIADKEVKEQIKPILEAILRSQPQTVVRTYARTMIQMTMPKRRYEKLGSPRVGEVMALDIKRA